MRWINDSKATNVGSTEAALNGLHLDGTLYLLLGGDGKSADFTPLSRYLTGDNVRLYCFGRDGAQLAALRRTSPCKRKPWSRRCARLRRRLSRVIWCCCLPRAPASISLKTLNNAGDIFARLAKELG